MVSHHRVFNLRPGAYSQLSFNLVRTLGGRAVRCPAQVPHGPHTGPETSHICLTGHAR